MIVCGLLAGSEKIHHFSRAKVNHRPKNYAINRAKIAEFVPIARASVSTAMAVTRVT